MIKYLILITVVSAVGGLGWFLDSRSNYPWEKPGVAARPVAVEDGSIHAPGRIEGSTREVELRTQVSGRIVEIAVQESQAVRKGDLLLRLDDEQYRFSVELAEAEVRLAEAALERIETGARREERLEAAAMLRARQADLQRAQLKWSRTSKLMADRVIAQQEADDHSTAVDSLKALVEADRERLRLLEAPARPDEVRMQKAKIAAAKSRLDLARNDLARSQLRAPRDGQILKVDVELGELTGPASSEPVIIMAPTEKYQVRASVDEIDAPRIELGMPAKITADGLLGTELTGRVVRLSPRMSAKELFNDRAAERLDTKTREVWIELDPAGPLVLGLPVDVTIERPRMTKPDGEKGDLKDRPAESFSRGSAGASPGVASAKLK